MAQSCTPLVSKVASFITAAPAAGVRQAVPLMASFGIGVGATAVLLLAACTCRSRSRQQAGQKGLYTFGEAPEEGEGASKEEDYDE